MDTKERYAIVRELKNNQRILTIPAEINIKKGSTIIFKQIGKKIQISLR